MRQLWPHGQSVLTLELKQHSAFFLGTDMVFHDMGGRFLNKARSHSIPPGVLNKRSILGEHHLAIVLIFPTDP